MKKKNGPSIKLANRIAAFDVDELATTATGAIAPQFPTSAFLLSTSYFSL
jgi:hypothetical protein